jgi:L-ascorbate metabolism protein UlaG (beta-lactamase superfamily)
MASSGSNSIVSVTFIGTATAIIDIAGVKFLTDPFFSPAGTSFEYAPHVILRNAHNPALDMKDLPPIDAVLLSHEDHWDNLDALGRQLLDGRYVFTTMDGAKNLAPRPGVRGMRPWEETFITLGGKAFQIVATPCVHVPGGECTGFIVTTESLGHAADSRPNAVYFTGDTIYTPELSRMTEKFHIVAAIMNTGEAKGVIEPPPAPPTQITMGGEQAARLYRDIKADWIVPMHFDEWEHFTQHKDDLTKTFEEEGVIDKVIWLVSGKPVRIL